MPSFAVSSFGGPVPYGVALTDLDGDRRVDLAFTSLSLDGAGNGGLWLLKNSTAPGAAVPALAVMATLPAGDEPHSVVIADFNGDGRPDLGTIDTTSSTAGVYFRRATTAAPTVTIGDASATGTIKPRR